MRLAWIAFTRTYHIKAFPQVTVAPTLRQGAEALMLNAGLGGLSCNTVCMPMLALDISGHVQVPDIKRSRDDYNMRLSYFLNVSPSASPNDMCSEAFNALPVTDAAEYCAIMHDTLRLELNLIIACNFAQGCRIAKSGAPFVGLVSDKTYTDIWLIGDLGDPAAPGSLSSLWGYSASVHKAHVRLAHPALPTIDGGSDVRSDDAPADGLQGMVALLLQLGSIADSSRLKASTGTKAAKLGKLRLFHVPSSTAGPLDCLTERVTNAHTLQQLCKRARIEISDDDIQVLMLIGSSVDHGNRHYDIIIPSCLQMWPIR